MNEWSPIVSKFDSAEAAEAYNYLCRNKAAESLADDRPVVAHNQAMGEIHGIIAAKRYWQGC